MLGSPPHLHFLSLLIFALAAVPAISDGVVFKVARVDTNTEGGRLFKKEMNDEYAESLMSSIASQTWNLLYGQRVSIERRVKKISLSVGQFTSDSSYRYIQDHDFEIYLNSGHLEKYGDSSGQEIHMLLTYEIARLLQHSAYAYISEAYKKGIAAYMVINFGYAPSRWPKIGAGKSWDESAAVTGQFFYYCSRKYAHFIKNLIAKVEASANGFFEVTGRTIPEAWSDYKTEHGSSCTLC